MTQTELFTSTPGTKRPKYYEPPSTHGYRSHKLDPPTSQEAADKAEKTGLVARQAWEVYTAFQEHGPATCKELSSKSGLYYHLISRRTIDLKRAGKLVGTGHKRDGAMELKAI